MSKKENFLILLIGPSGVGKNTLISQFLEKNREFNFLITGTARDKRDYEIDGVHRHFYTKEEFEKGIENNEFYEYALVHKTYYGVPKKSIELPIKENKSIIGEIDYQGAKTFISKKNELPCHLITIFIDFEDISMFRDRILSRQEMNESEIQVRLESMKKELEVKKEFDLLTTSYEGDFKKSFDEFEELILNKINILKNE